MVVTHPAAPHLSPTPNPPSHKVTGSALPCRRHRHPSLLPTVTESGRGWTPPVHRTSRPGQKSPKILKLPLNWENDFARHPVNTAGRVAAIADAPVTTEVIPDSLDQLRKLAELRDAGIVTAEEFEAKKAKLQYSPDERHRAPQTTSAGWLGNGSRAALTARWPRRASRPGRCHFPRHPGEVSGVAGAGNHASCRALFRAVATR